MYDLVIIGGGPAGVAAGVYAARKKMKTLLVVESFGGQSFTSADIQNWIGTKSLTGFDLAKNLEEHVRAQEDIEIVTGDVVTEVSKKDGAGSASFSNAKDMSLTTKGFIVKTQKGSVYETKYVLVASGSRRRKLNVPGEKEFDGRGVVYCSTCDAPLFKDRVVAVVGGGNAGLEAVIDLFPYASKIYLLEYSNAVKGDPLTFGKIKTNSKVEIVTMAETSEILGDKFVTGLKYLDRKTNETKKLELGGVFVEIGALPNSEIVKGLVDINASGEIIVDQKTEQTSCPGIWAVGDVSDVLYKQNNISAGDAIKAVLNIHEKLCKE
jgi:NADH-dependent peroxiredoxin subunit F